MLKIYTGLGIFVTFALAGCLSTKYAGGYDETYEPVKRQVEAPMKTRVTSNSHRVIPVRFQSLRCPAGTTPHAKSGTCLMDAASTPLPAPSVISASTTGSQNLIPVTVTTQPRTTRRHYGGANYRVRTGDTVYSLARARCLPVATLQAVNGLDATYTIHVGDRLHLPPSQC